LCTLELHRAHTTNLIWNFDSSRLAKSALLFFNFNQFLRRTPEIITTINSMHAISLQIRHAKPTQYALFLMCTLIVMKVPTCTVKKIFLEKSRGRGVMAPWSPRWCGPCYNHLISIPLRISGMPIYLQYFVF